MTTKYSGYNVYHCPDGSSESYYGYAETLDAARKLARTGRALEECLYATAEAAGQCGDLYAPDKSCEDEDGIVWLDSHDGYDCAIPLVACSHRSGDETTECQDTHEDTQVYFE